MPKITEQRIHVDSRWFSAERDVERTKGIHLSHVIDYIEGKERDAAGLSNDGHAYAAGGFMWERLLEKLIDLNPYEMWEWLFSRTMIEPKNPSVFRPGEQSLDIGECPKCAGTGTADASLRNPDESQSDCGACYGTGRITLYLTPDGYSIPESALEEWKYTTKSCKGITTSTTPVESPADSPIRGPKFARWIRWQIPCYLKALGLDTCRLRVYFARGDYSGSPVPQWCEFVLTYTQQEIDEIWEMVVTNAMAMIQEAA